MTTTSSSAYNTTTTAATNTSTTTKTTSKLTTKNYDDSVLGNMASSRVAVAAVAYKQSRHFKKTGQSATTTTTTTSITRRHHHHQLLVRQDRNAVFFSSSGTALESSQQMHKHFAYTRAAMARLLCVVLGIECASTTLLDSLSRLYIAHLQSYAARACRYAEYRGRTAVGLSDAMHAFNITSSSSTTITSPMLKSWWDAADFLPYLQSSQPPNTCSTSDISASVKCAQILGGRNVAKLVPVLEPCQTKNSNININNSNFNRKRLRVMHEVNAKSCPPLPPLHTLFATPVDAHAEMNSLQTRLARNVEQRNVSRTVVQRLMLSHPELFTETESLVQHVTESSEWWRRALPRPLIVPPPLPQQTQQQPQQQQQAQVQTQATVEAAVVEQEQLLPRSGIHLRLTLPQQQQQQQQQHQQQQLPSPLQKPPITLSLLSDSPKKI
jgi:hypothetical protein